MQANILDFASNPFLRTKPPFRSLLLVFFRAMKKYLPALAALALAGCAHSQYRTTYLEEYAGMTASNCERSAWPSKRNSIPSGGKAIPAEMGNLLCCILPLLVPVPGLECQTLGRGRLKMTMIPLVQGLTRRDCVTTPSGRPWCNWNRKTVATCSEWPKLKGQAAAERQSIQGLAP